MVGAGQRACQGKKCACRVIQWTSSGLSVPPLHTILQLVQALTMLDILKSPVRPCSDFFLLYIPHPAASCAPIPLADTDA